MLPLSNRNCKPKSSGHRPFSPAEIAASGQNGGEFAIGPPCRGRDVGIYCDFPLPDVQEHIWSCPQLLQQRNVVRLPDGNDVLYESPCNRGTDASEQFRNRPSFRYGRQPSLGFAGGYIHHRREGAS
jgi:hypothetical protein